MTPPSHPLDARLLLEHSAWMRRLARTLVRDVERAEELSQETWLRLLERPPALDRPFRGWIATVMRNLVRAERRGAARREERERTSARPEAQPSAAELLERAALQRELVQAVLELDEPYRTAILLRYLEERSPREIAAREQVPLATVKTRLARGITRLREYLSRERGPDGRTSALVLLARMVESSRVPPWLPLTAGTLAVNAKTAALLVLALAAGLAYFLFPREHERESPPSGPEVQAAGGEEPGRASSPGSAPGEERTPRREALEVERPARTAEEPAVAGKVVARGRVIDERGAPVPGVELRTSPGSSLQLPLSGAPVVARAGNDGTFELTAGSLESIARLFVSDSRWTTLLAGVPVSASSGQESLVVAAPRIQLAGVVVDELGSPLDGVRVAVEPSASLRSRLSRVLDFSSAVEWSARSDEDGRFRLEEAPALEAGALVARADGFRPLEQPVPARSRDDLVLVLARTGAARTTLAGLVVDPAGAPVPDALVSHGLDTTRTDGEGRFSFRLDDPEAFNRLAERIALPVPAGLLRAVKPGYLPAELRARERDGEGRSVWPEPLVLHLGGEPPSIDGFVQDEHGEPLAGIRVWLADPTFFGGLPSGSGPERFPMLAQVESLLAGQEPGWNWVVSDADGRFTLSGLTEREYVVAAMDPRTLLRTDEEGVNAGRRDVVLVLRTAGLFPALSGRVVDAYGEPVAGVTVHAMCDALETRIEGQVVQTQHEEIPGTATDAEGRFTLERVPRELVYLRLDGADTLPLEWGRDLDLAELVGGKPEDLVITVERRCHFQVELAVPEEADELGVLDTRGDPLVISEFFGNGRRDTERHAIREGRSSTLAAGDRAAVLVLYRAGAEVRRVPIRLASGAPTVIRP